MRPFTIDELAAWRKSARATTSSIPGWALGAVFVAWVTSSFNGFPVVLREFPVAAWCAAVFFAYAVQWWLGRPFVRQSDVLPSRGRAHALLAAGFTSECIFRLPSLWLFPTGQVGMLCAALLLGAGIVGAYVVGRWSPKILVVTAAPSALYLAGIPLFDLIQGGATVRHVVVLIACLLFLAALLPLLLTSIETEREERKQREELERRRHEAESATAAKSTFVAVVSHELRTPISAILAGATELERTAKEPAGRSNARMILDAGAMMRTLLNDLLDAAKLEAGRMSVEEVAFDLRQLIADQMRLWRAEARNKGLRLRLAGAHSAPRMMLGDPTRLRQILSNLLSNALKFTEEGSVGLNISRDDLGDGRCELLLEVVDTGKGMTEVQVEGLFTPFAQAEASIARTHGGTGLGLAISRDLARLMGGEISVSSRVGHGSRFTLRLKLSESEVIGAPAAEELSTAPRDFEGMSVLVVDDHEINRRAITLMLEPLALSVSTATSGAEALRLLAQHPFDLVLMDVYMPELSGHDATRALRAVAGPNQATPVIAVTGATTDADIKNCLAAGMNGSVAKPIDASELYSEIARLTAAHPRKDDASEVRRGA